MISTGKAHQEPGSLMIPPLDHHQKFIAMTAPHPATDHAIPVLALKGPRR